MSGQQKLKLNCLSEDEYQVLERLAIDPSDEDTIIAVLKLYHEGYTVRKICQIMRLGIGCD